MVLESKEIFWNLSEQFRCLEVLVVGQKKLKIHHMNCGNVKDIPVNTLKCGGVL
jgi:hypothetical protein